MKPVKVLDLGSKRCDALTLAKDAADTTGIDVTIERMKVFRLAPHLTLALLAACASQPAAAPASIGACQSTINVYGSRTELNEHPDTVAVSLRDVALSPNAIGYGPGAGYLAELTVVDGVWQIARATGPGAVTVDTVPGENAGAMFLVTASPDAWAKRTLDTPVEGMTDLEAMISKSAASSGCGAGAVPFKLTGKIQDADWSVVGRPSGARGRIDETAVTLIGLYDPVEADRYFMPKGRSIHVHILTGDGRLSGHLDDFASLEAGTLSLPE
ncbi:MAG: hypothetical protein Q8S09_10450 [Hyphomonas sp.]|nr:hypothetical protein [Hyphomonas sp.]